jgi:hypothetical protein
MGTRGGNSPVVRRVLRVLAVWTAGQAALLLLGRLAARRLDRGDETSTDIRRVLVQTGVELRPTNPGLTRVRVDTVMGGGLIDLTGIPRVAGGLDVTLRAVMGGVAVRVPPGWRTWWSFRGLMGGVGVAAGIDRASDPTSADLRVHAVAVMGGVGIERPEV